MKILSSWALYHSEAKRLENLDFEDLADGEVNCDHTSAHHKCICGAKYRVLRSILKAHFGIVDGSVAEFMIERSRG